jgi:cytochrome c peroxidase
VIRDDDGFGEDAAGIGPFSYATLLRGTDPALPPALRLPDAFRLNPDTATDEDILHACAQLVVAFLSSLQFSRDASGSHDGSPYDAFLAANRLPRAPARDQSAADYGRRIGEQLAALRLPRFVHESGRTLRFHSDQPFRFGPIELEGMRIFFRGAIGADQKSGAGNCAECHVPPLFTDFKFHNTGTAQDEYDSLHGAGAFQQLNVPNAATRDVDFDRWLPPTPRHPFATGPFASVPNRDAPGKADLGLWNVHGNPDLPAPQPALERLFNSARRLSRDEVLARTLGRFKTSSLRSLGQSAPYFHTGQQPSIEDAVAFYQRMSDLARTGKMRNAPAEYFAMRISADDIAPLAAFLRALNEDFDGALRVPALTRAAQR